MCVIRVQDFYEDIFEELSKYGEIENLNVCDNLADHMVIFCELSILVNAIFSYLQQYEAEDVLTV